MDGRNTMSQPAAIKTMGRVNRSSLRKIFRKNWQLYIIILLPLLQVIIFKYLPIYGIQIAFKDFRVSQGFLNSPFVGIKHFARFLSTPSALQIILNTFFISVYSIAASIPFAIVLAISVNEVKSKFLKKTVQMVTYAPYFISTVVMVSIIMQFLNPRNGIGTTILHYIGINAMDLLGESSMFKSIYVWTGVWQTTGYTAIIFIAALSSISPDLHEAALIDGASKIKKIIYIDFPTILPTIVILLVIYMGFVMSVGFEKVYLMQNSLNLDSSEVLSTYVYRMGIISMDYSFSTAVGLFNSVVNCILLVLSNFIARKYTDSSLW
jgi:putative aldouronate transport system permease protein